MSDFESIFAFERLVIVLDSLLDSHFDVIAERHWITTGADRLELDLFLRDRDLHLATISRKVLEGRYTFGPYLEKQIPKPGSKEPRTISVASIRDSVVQRAIYEYLYPSVDATLSPSVFGYRKGCSTHHAVRAIRHHFAEDRIFVFDADLQKFFDSVNHEMLLEMVGRLGIDDRAKLLIRRFLKTGRILSTQVEEHRASKGKPSRFIPEPRLIGVPQGGVLSGLLSNLYLSQFDSAIRTVHPGYVRYADDFLVCCRSAAECQHVHVLASEQLSLLRLELHPTKTVECVSAESGVDFLGFRISTRGVRVGARNIARFKARIREVFATQRMYQSTEKTLQSLVRRLQFKIRGPNEQQLKKLAERGKIISPCRRSWIGFFRIVDDFIQIRGLDRWLRGRISAFMWENCRCRVSLKHMKRYGLPSLINSLWKARLIKKPPARG